MLRQSDKRTVSGEADLTLIELLAVTLAVLFVAYLLIPRVYSGPANTKAAAAQSDEATLSAALHQFHLDCKRYPTSREGVAALLRAPATLKKDWKGPYLTKAVDPDPWGNPYRYSESNDHFTITSRRASAADIVDAE